MCVALDSSEVTVTSLRPPRQCLLAIFSIKPTLLSLAPYLTLSSDRPNNILSPPLCDSVFLSGHLSMCVYVYVSVSRGMEFNAQNLTPPGAAHATYLGPISNKRNPIPPTHKEGQGESGDASKAAQNKYNCEVT